MLYDRHMVYLIHQNKQKPFIFARTPIGSKQLKNVKNVKNVMSLLLLLLSFQKSQLC